MAASWRTSLPGASTTASPNRGVPVGTIKRHVTGKGNAPVDDNEADAIALLLWALEARPGDGR